MRQLPAVVLGVRVAATVPAIQTLAAVEGPDRKPDVEREAGAVRLRLGPITALLLPIAASTRKADRYGSESGISFDVVVPDVDAAVEALEAAGGQRIDVIDDGAGWAVADPDGNIIEVIGG